MFATFYCNKSKVVLYYSLERRVIEMSTNRGLKNRVAISTAIEKDIYKRLKEYSEKTSIPLSKLMDKAIDAFLKTVE